MERTGATGEPGGTGVASTTERAVEVLPPYGHPAFSGSVPARLEPTGRLAIPAVFRSAFGSQARLRPYRDQHLMLWTDRAFELVADALATTGGLIDPQVRKNLHRATHTAGVDRQGRLIVPPEMRERVGITDQVVVVGAIEVLEIYSVEAFERLG
ncbi:MAG: hypothetical protein KF703_19225, partial [Actinobacteria bacterium]|nr:hypothetical protein [Actinomycetota bacterium]